MAKFLDKKEQVIDFKLTSYGRYLLSIGSFKPSYYAFFDNNIMYDTRYVRQTPGGRPIQQNKISKRIIDDTSYFETVSVFRNINATINDYTGEIINALDTSETTLKITPEPDIFKVDSIIGDAFLDGPTDAAPAWQVLMMQNKISSSVYKTDYSFDRPDMPGALVNSKTPQINIQAIYTLKIADPEFDYNAENVRDLVDQSTIFADNKVIQLQMNDPIMYFNEINTQLLTENFEIEVFEVISGSKIMGDLDLYSPTLERKYFEKKIPQIENGFMMTETPLANEEQNLTTASVEYYFDALTDASVNHAAACAGAQVFSKKGYYIDFDFNCETKSGDAVFYDIYGSVTEPEICQT